jgi:hypothetical protein
MKRQHVGNPAEYRGHLPEVKPEPPKGLPKVRAHWKAGYYAATQ